MDGRSRLLVHLMALVAVSAWGQTSADIGAKYSAVNAFEVRPGILMTTKYADDGQVCEMTLEKRHYQPDKVDLGSTIPNELIDRLLDELVPSSQRGPATSRWLHPDSTVGGGVSYIKQEFENVFVEIYGGYSEACDSGDQIVVIRWKKRTCAAPQSQAMRKK